MCEKRYAKPFQSTRHSNQAYELPTPVYIVFHSSLLIAYSYLVEHFCMLCQKVYLLQTAIGGSSAPFGHLKPFFGGPVTAKKLKSPA